MVFPQKEIHVIELDRICVIFRNKVPQNGDGSLRRLHALFTPVGGMDSAEAAIEWTTDARMMNSRALSEKGRSKILLYRQAMKRRPRETIRPFHWSFGIIAMKTETIFIGKPENAVQRTLATKRINQFKQR